LAQYLFADKLNYFMKNIHIVVVLILFPILMNAQVDVAESNSSVGFNHQIGGQIGLLGVYAYMERSIGLSWTYRADVGFDFQGHDPLQDGDSFSSRLIPVTSIEMRRYWSTRKEGHSNFVSLKAKKLSKRSIVLSGSSEDLSIQQSQILTSLFIGRNMNIKSRGRLEVGLGVDIHHQSGDFFKISFAPAVHLRFGLVR
jgi:hypothetical protein